MALRSKNIFSMQKKIHRVELQWPCMPWLYSVDLFAIIVCFERNIAYSNKLIYLSADLMLVESPTILRILPDDSRPWRLTYRLDSI